MVREDDQRAAPLLAARHVGPLSEWRQYGMSYQYSVEKPRLFTEEAQRGFLQIRDHARSLLKTAGAFRASAAWQCPHEGLADSWLLLACLDRLVELGEIRRVDQGERCAGQDEIYVEANR